MRRWLTKLGLKYLKPLWNAVPAWVESLWYDRSKGLDVYRLLCSLGPNLSKIENHLQIYDFKWSPDPLGGILDFRSLAWVTCARGAGDCDDWAHLWYRILKRHGTVEKMYSKKKGGGAHAMTVFTLNGVCYLLSNLSLRTKVGILDKKILLTNFYGEETDFSIIY
jgi:hypothetical protein